MFDVNFFKTEGNFHQIENVHDFFHAEKVIKELKKILEENVVMLTLWQPHENCKQAEAKCSMR